MYGVEGSFLWEYEVICSKGLFPTLDSSNDEHSAARFMVIVSARSRKEADTHIARTVRKRVGRERKINTRKLAYHFCTTRLHPACRGFSAVEVQGPTTSTLPATLVRKSYYQRKCRCFGVSESMYSKEIKRGER